MKQAKKLASLLLALVMVLSLATTAFAASGTNTNNGTITIDNAVKDETYSIYQILSLESYDTDKGTYSYKATTAWKGFVDTSKYFSVDANGYVTATDELTDATAATFAKDALAYAKDTSHAISATKSEKANNTSLVFNELNLGYYLVDSTVGTLCSLDTTNPNVTIQDKNPAPTIEKKVQEDSDNT